MVYPDPYGRQKPCDLRDREPCVVGRIRQNFETTSMRCAHGASKPLGSAAGIAVMMPYLHWDTDRNQEVFSRIIRTETVRQRIRMKDTAEHDHD